MDVIIKGRSCAETHVFDMLGQLCILPEELCLCGGQGGMRFVRVDVKDMDMLERDGHCGDSTARIAGDGNLNALVMHPPWQTRRGETELLFTSSPTRL